MGIDEQKAKLISICIKVAITVVALTFFAILLSQYIMMSNLTKQNASLNAQLSNVSEQAQTVKAEYDNLTGDGKNEYYTDTARDKFDYTEDGEILINKD